MDATTGGPFSEDDAELLTKKEGEHRLENSLLFDVQGRSPGVNTTFSTNLPPPPLPGVFVFDRPNQLQKSPHQVKPVTTMPHDIFNTIPCQQNAHDDIGVHSTSSFYQSAPTNLESTVADGVDPMSDNSIHHIQSLEPISLSTFEDAQFQSENKVYHQLHSISPIHYNLSEEPKMYHEMASVSVLSDASVKVNYTPKNYHQLNTIPILEKPLKVNKTFQELRPLKSQHNDAPKFSNSKLYQQLCQPLNKEENQPETEKIELLRPVTVIEFEQSSKQKTYQSTQQQYSVCSNTTDTNLPNTTYPSPPIIRTEHDIFQSPNRDSVISKADSQISTPKSQASKNTHFVDSPTKTSSGLQLGFREDRPKIYLELRNPTTRSELLKSPSHQNRQLVTPPKQEISTSLSILPIITRVLPRLPKSPEFKLPGPNQQLVTPPKQEISTSLSILPTITRVRPRLQKSPEFKLPGPYEFNLPQQNSPNKYRLPKILGHNDYKSYESSVPPFGIQPSASLLNSSSNLLNKNPSFNGVRNKVALSLPKTPLCYGDPGVSNNANYYSNNISLASSSESREVQRPSTPVTDQVAMPTPDQSGKQCTPVNSPSKLLEELLKPKISFKKHTDTSKGQTADYSLDKCATDQGGIQTQVTSGDKQCVQNSYGIESQPSKTNTQRSVDHTCLNKSKVLCKNKNSGVSVEIPNQCKKFPVNVTSSETKTVKEHQGLESSRDFKSVKQSVGCMMLLGEAEIKEHCNQDSVESNGVLKQQNVESKSIVSVQEPITLTNSCKSKLHLDKTENINVCFSSPNKQYEQVPGNVFNLDNIIVNEPETLHEVHSDRKSSGNNDSIQVSSVEQLSNDMSLIDKNKSPDSTSLAIRQTNLKETLAVKSTSNILSDCEKQVPNLNSNHIDEQIVQFCSGKDDIMSTVENSKDSGNNDPKVTETSTFVGRSCSVVIKDVFQGAKVGVSSMDSNTVKKLKGKVVSTKSFQDAKAAHQSNSDASQVATSNCNTMSQDDVRDKTQMSLSTERKEVFRDCQEEKVRRKYTRRFIPEGERRRHVRRKASWGLKELIRREKRKYKKRKVKSLDSIVGRKSYFSEGSTSDSSDHESLLTELGKNKEEEDEVSKDNLGTSAQFSESGPWKQRRKYTKSKSWNAYHERSKWKETIGEEKNIGEKGRIATHKPRKIYKIIDPLAEGLITDDEGEAVFLGFDTYDDGEMILGFESDNDEDGSEYSFETNVKETDHMTVECDPLSLLLPADNTLSCSQCSDRFHSHGDLVAHMQLHTVSRTRTHSYACSVCFKDFSSQLQLDRHVMWTHQKVNNVGKEQKNKVLVVWTVASIKKYKCSTCSKKFKTKHYAKFHAQNAHREQETFIFISWTKANIKKYKCSICTNNFTTRAYAEVHAKNAHWEQETNMFGSSATASINKYKCTTCTKKFATEAYAKIHARSAHGEQESKIIVVNLKPNCRKPKKYTCSKCPKRFSNKQYARRHAMYAHKEQDTKACEKVHAYARGEQETKINIVSLKPDNLRLKKYTCSKCPKRFSNKQYARRHAMYAHLEQETKAYEKVHDNARGEQETKITVLNLKPKNLKPKKYTCSLCPKRFTNKQYARRHAMYAHVEQETKIHKNWTFETNKTYKCYKCPKKFSTEAYAKIHSRRAHEKQETRVHVDGTNEENERNISVQNTDKGQGTNIKNASEDHETSKHVNCENQEDGFENKNSIHTQNAKNEKETNIHEYWTPEGGKKFKCPKCPKMFASKQYAKIHVTNAHEEHEKSIHVVCEKEEDGLGGKGNIHTPNAENKQGKNIQEYWTPEGGKKFKCPECPKMFASKQYAKVHVINAHEEYEKSIHVNLKTIEDGIGGKSNIHTQNAENRQEQHIHKYSTVESGRKYKCPKCPMMFASKQFAKIHAQNDHKDHETSKHVNRENDEDRFGSNSNIHTLNAESEQETNIDEYWTPEGGKKFKCPKCPKMFASKQYAKVHVINAHEEHEKSIHIKCENDEDSFERNGNTHTQNADSEQYTNIHEYWTPEGGKKFKCPKCPKMFASKQYVKIHVQNTHEENATKIYVKWTPEGFKKYKCSKCVKIFSSKAYAQRHAENVHDKHMKETKIDAETNNRKEELNAMVATSCKQEEIGMTSQTGMKEEENIVTAKTVQSIGEMIVTPKTSNQEQGRNMTAHNSHQEDDVKIKTFYCADCTLTFPTEHELLEHETKVHKKTLYQCEKCLRSFQKLANLQRHKLSHSGEDESQSFPCAYCNESFSSRESLHAHWPTHSEKKMYTCDVCNSNFTALNSLKRHKILHTGEKLFRCEICQKSFSLLSTLKTHLLIHTGTRRYECKLCGKMFNRKDVLNAHQWIHTGEKKFQCDICLQKFRWRHAVKSHKLIYHSTEKPYSCKVCGKSFSHPDSYKKHAEVHADRKFYCQICLKSFSRGSSLKAHIVTHTDVKPFKCEKCHNAFRSKSHLRNHLLVHSKEKPCLCKFCDKTFKNWAQLCRHKRIVHCKAFYQRAKPSFLSVNKTEENFRTMAATQAGDDNHPVRSSEEVDSNSSKDVISLPDKSDFSSIEEKVIPPSVF